MVLDDKALIASVPDHEVRDPLTRLSAKHG
jgi:hypothetical protein